MDKQEAELLYDTGKEPTVTKLLEQDALIKLLQQKLGEATTNSTNSSKPPSSDAPGVKHRKKTPSNRKQGGQDGHDGKNRPLLPVEQMDHVHDYYPDICEKCHKALTPGLCPEPSEPFRHQTFELPEMEPIKTEYRCHELLCSCGHRTCAPLPPEVAKSNFGLRVHAAIAYLTSVHRGTRRGIAEIMNTLFKIDISLGATCATLERVSQASEPVTEKIQQHIAQAEALNIDETGWKNKGVRCYLWVFVSSLAVFFHIAHNRGAKVLSEILGASFPGIITSDDHSAYNKYHKKGVRQLCWAHIIRKLKALKESRGSPDAYLFSKKLLHEVGTLFAAWHAFKDGKLSRQQLWGGTSLIRARIKKLCLHYQGSTDKCVQTRASRLIKNWSCLFTFLRYEGVEPTNNSAERAVRPAVQWRKICFGSQSDNGERFTERILTVTRTCQLQGKNPFEFLCQLMTAHFNNAPLPSIFA